MLYNMERRFIAIGLRLSADPSGAIGANRGRGVSSPPPPKISENHQNHWKILVFGPQVGPPCVLYVRAVILVMGNPWGMPPTLSFDDFLVFSTSL